MNVRLSILSEIFTIHRFSPGHEIPPMDCLGKFFSVSRTDEEVSIVCAASVHLDSERSETGWACVKVLGPLSFSLTGILAGITTVLAAEKITIFAISTFDTDYLLVKSESLQAAQTALQQAGYLFYQPNPERRNISE